jgi:signal transduction histidine kinase
MTTNERTQHLERLLAISRTLSTSLDLEPFLHSLISAASELTGCEVASILEMDEGGEQLRFLALPWFHRDALQTVKVPLEGSIAGWVFLNAKPVVVPDVTAEPRHFKQVDLAAEFKTRSILAAPIIYQGETLGVLEAINKTDQANYTEDDLTILETLASQAAVAIQNTRLVVKARKSLDEMAQLDRMKSDFIAIASHELRTPLGLVLGHATFLREAVPAEYHPQLDIIVRNSMRLKEIIDSIANMDNVQRGMASLRRSTFSIKRVVEEVVDSFHQDAGKKHITLHVDLGPDDLVVEGDASKISIALSNLVRNGITFTDVGGNVHIAAERIPGYVKVSVIDDGIGIPARDLPHVFERFYQVESHLTRKHGGMGLGLSVAKVMIEMHGGRIWVESVDGKGSNFSFILPLNPVPADAGSRLPAT